ncbi:hypothetical protein CVIRNUC_000974 [Coccomyxa viridis]|uniref:Uncharacterized protein n=1 Tax=Coccomyxa viridis TaxID=1274662 RepID=A0AAV1HUN8_9CHLO|nr:hypothetical protein CVIRNUC_000974 [Coccomyxa viridis]
MTGTNARVFLGLFALSVITASRDVQAGGIRMRGSLGANAAHYMPRKASKASRDELSHHLEGSLHGVKRDLQSQTCIGVSQGNGGGHVGCGLQWGLPSCCDSNPNTNSGYSCSPAPPFEGCSSGKWSACCTLF